MWILVTSLALVVPDDTQVRHTADGSISIVGDPLARHDKDGNELSVRAPQTISWVTGENGDAYFKNSTLPTQATATTDALSTSAAIAEPEDKHTLSAVAVETEPEDKHTLSAVAVEKSLDSPPRPAPASFADVATTSTVKKMMGCKSVTTWNGNENYGCYAERMMDSAKKACSTAPADQQAKCCTGTDSLDKCPLVKPYVALFAGKSNTGLTVQERSALNDEWHDVKAKSGEDGYLIIKNRIAECKNAWTDLKNGFSAIGSIATKADKVVEEKGNLKGDDKEKLKKFTSALAAYNSEFDSKTPDALLSKEDYKKKTNFEYYEETKDHCFEDAKDWKKGSKKSTVFLLMTQFKLQYGYIRTKINQEITKVRNAVDAVRTSVLGEQGEKKKLTAKFGEEPNCDSMSVPVDTTDAEAAKETSVAAANAAYSKAVAAKVKALVTALTQANVGTNPDGNCLSKGEACPLKDKWTDALLTQVKDAATELYNEAYKDSTGTAFKTRKAALSSAESTFNSDKRTATSEASSATTALKNECKNAKKYIDAATDADTEIKKFKATQLAAPGAFSDADQ